MASSSTESLPRGLRRWLAACAVVGAALALSALVEIPWRSALRGYDNTFNYLWLRSAAVDGDWDFRNDIAGCNTLAAEDRASALALPVTPAGRLPNKYGVGWAVASAPFYAVADGVVALGRMLGWWSLDRDGWNPVYQVCLQLGHAALALAALWLAARAIASWAGVDRAAALAGVSFVWAASPLLYYQTSNVAMSHGVAFFAVALMLFALAKAKMSGAAVRWPWLLAGAGWGLAVTTRFACGIFGIVAVWVFIGMVRQRRCGWAAPVFFVLGAAPFVVLQLVAWRCVYGEWLLFSYGAEGESFHWAQPALGHALFSPWHGLLYWHPFLLVAAGALAGWAIQGRHVALPLAAAFLIILYINAAWWCWWFGAAFGNRGFDAALLPLMGGTAWLFQRTAASRWRRILWSLAIAAAVWNLYVLILYRAGAIPRNEPVTWTGMIEAASRLPQTLRF
jgi:hypothetical protein